MMNSSRLLSLALTLCFGSAASAGAPGGVFEQQVGGANEIWFLSGDHTECDGDAQLTACITTHFDTNGSGGVTGSGSIDFTGLIEANLPLVITGQMAGTAAKPLGKIAASFSGPATISSDGVTIDGTAFGGGKLTCRNPLSKMNPTHSDLFTCRGAMKLCFEAMIGPRKRRVCDGGAGFEMMVSAAGGPWTLAMDLMTDPNGVVTGTATTTLANAAVENHLVTGKYKVTNDQTILKVVSSDPLSKNKLNLNDRLMQKGVLRSHVLTFKVAGETGKQTDVSVEAP